jgi:drug/metabolite transporter (DMT)-like permease
MMRTAGVILVVFLWALCYPLIALGLADAPPLLLAAMRASASGVLLLVTGAISGRPFPNGWTQWLGVAIIGVGTTTLGFGGMFLAGGRVSPGLATVLSSTQPLIAAMLGYVALSDWLGKRGALALALGFAGVGLVASDGLAGNGSFGIVGVLYVLLAALGVAVGNVLLKKLVKRFDPLTALGGQFALGSLPLWAGTIALEDLAGFRWSGSLVLVYAALVVLGTVIPAVLWFALLVREDLNRMNAFTFLTPIFALALGAAFFDERLAALQWVGTVMVLAAVMLSVSFRSMERIAARLWPTP